MKTTTWYGFVHAIITVILLIAAVFSGSAMIVYGGVPPVGAFMFMVVMFVLIGTAITESIRRVRLRKAQEQARIDAAWDKLLGSHMDTAEFNNRYTEGKWK